MDAHRRKTKELGHVILAKTSIMILIQVNKCLCPFPLLSHWIFINNFSFIYFECRLSLIICTEALLYCRESIEKRVSTLNCCGRKNLQTLHFISSMNRILKCKKLSQCKISKLQAVCFHYALQLTCSKRWAVVKGGSLNAPCDIYY